MSFQFSVFSKIWVMKEIGQKSRSFKDLEVWKQSIQFAKEVYKLTEKFPSHELYGLTSQIRKAAVSIPSNIAEGNAEIHPENFGITLRWLWVPWAKWKPNLSLPKKLII